MIFKTESGQVSKKYWVPGRAQLGTGYSYQSPPISDGIHLSLFDVSSLMYEGIVCSLLRKDKEGGKCYIH